MYPKEIQDLVDAFSQFPSIGPKTAQRFVFYLLRRNSNGLEQFVTQLRNLKHIVPCSVCGNFSTQKLCPVCSDAKRDKSLVTVVSEPQDLMAIEGIGEYKGMYHILGGLIDTTKNISPQSLRIKQLLKRLEDPQVKELIFALDATMEGESTTLYIINIIKKVPKLSKQIKLTKIARGLPLGAEIEYADEVTLSDALKSRKII
ncbi:recombination mediator RecR [Patescibacteria group bacterium AH-259-L07]|nr:recombination mediator RecR [Patescibacteria group bacterium AH-259-L07]